ncbi:MAG: GAF domain-containing protein [Bryobacteraceae bacterium]|jgi:GAF domain-containing protein/CheY-like chemotaxis protein
MRVLNGLALLLLALPAARSGLAQTALTLGELNARTPRDYGAAHLREDVSIRGTVNALPFHFPEYTILTIQDGAAGAALHTPVASPLLDDFRPGDVVEATGSVITLGGMVMVDAVRATKVSRAAGFQAATATIEDLHRFSAFGKLVRTKGRLVGRGSTTAGPFLLIGSDQDFYRIFFPVRDERLYPALPQMSPGDEIEAVGVAFQYAAGKPPYNRGFELLATAPPVVIPAVSGWWWSPLAVLAAVLAVTCAALLMAARERRLRRQRELLRTTYQLGEEIFGAASIAKIQKRLDEGLPLVLGVTRVRLYRYNRSAKQLDAVGAGHGDLGSISLSAPPDGPQAGAAACFHYRSLLAIPDVSRSPFPVSAGEGQPNPKSLLFVPMMAQGEVAGVLELDQDDRVRDFSAAEQSLAQHLGNQVGVALRMLDQRSVQEQLSRTEKLAAVGRLISSIVNELEQPLASIQELAGQARERARQAPVERELAGIGAEAQKAASVVARLVTFASSEQVEARPVAVGDLLRSLIEFRESDWKASGIRVHDVVFREPLKVLGSHGQLEQVFLNLLVHAEQALANAPQKTLTIRTSVLAKRLLVEISFSVPGEWRNAEETASVLGLTQSVVAGHGGEVRLIEKNNSEPRFEVELPLAGRERATSAAEAARPEDAPRRMTALVIEPDEAVERQLLTLLERSGARAIPVNNADTALELAGRARIDAAFCSVHAHGLNWVELSERMRPRVGAFVLMPDRYDAELAADFEGENCFVLPKPIQEAELADILDFAERAPLAKVVSIKNGVA